MVCFCLPVMPGPSGSSQINKSMSFDKHASHPHAHVLPGAVWFIRVKVTDVWKAPDETQPLHEPAHRQHTHRHMHTRLCITCPLPLPKLESSLFVFAHAHTRSSRCFFRWQCVYHQPTHTAPGYSITCGTPLISKLTDTQCSPPPPPPPHHSKHDLIKTTLTLLLSSHLCSLPLCNEVSE